MPRNINKNQGFTLVEILIVVAILIVIVTALSTAYVQIFRLLNLNKVKVLALDIANEQIEIVRNLPYSEVGEISGIPSGKIPQNQNITRSGISFNVVATIRNVDDPFDGRIGQSPNDTAPADYKMVQFDVSLPSNPQFKTLSLVTYVAPKSLENSSTNGALFINVFDANGNPVSGAQVHIENTALAPDVIIDDVTNAQGRLDIVDVPPSNGGYHVEVTKGGFSAEQTYPQGGAGNPNPAKPDATVLTQQVTQVSFAIDEVSALNVSTVDASCQVIPSVDFTLKGSKLIGTNPNTYKYPSAGFSTNGSGLRTISTLEWDSYELNVTDSGYDLIGSNPLWPLNVLPDSVTDVQMVVAPKNPRTLLVGVKDSATGLPVTGATVTISQGGSEEESSTGRGFIRQTDWSGGAGQTNWSDATRYASSNGNIEVVDAAGEMKLREISGSYVSSGELTSSIIDMGTITNFSQITWNPNDQPPATGADSVRFQIALSNENTATTTWNYIGPDGTSDSYFTVANQNIGATGNNARYIRYKAFLSTDSAAVTPNISDVLITFTSSCVPPGQVVFTSLASGIYNITVSKAGYEDYEGTITLNGNYLNTVITLSP
jgi:prepilin-type N-terminal cleavage/methylation domain-containing protein